MALESRGGLRGGDSPVMRTEIIDNSDALRAGDAVTHLNGDLEAANTAGDAIFGIVIEIVDAAGLVLSSFGITEPATLATLGGGSLTDATPDTITVASDNETVDKAACKIDLSMESIFTADQNGTMNTTLSSDKGGGWVDLTDQRTVDESSYTRTIGTGGQFYNWGVDPQDTENMLVSIHESEFYGLGKTITTS